MEEPTASTSTAKPSLIALGISASTLYGRRKLREDAEFELFEKITEKEALEHLWLTKPAYLVQDGSDVWLDQRDVDAKMDAIILKFIINSLRDRADRLKYLLTVLKKKWAKKPDCYKAMLTFMMAISSLRTDNFELKVRTTNYSTTVEKELGAEFTLHGRELKQALLRKRKFRDKVVKELLALREPVTTYSSGEELSDWGPLSGSEDEEENSKVKKQISVRPKSGKARIPEEKKKEMVAKFWEEEARNAESYLRTHLRRIEPTPLTDQPVISSPMALYTRFGEHWYKADQEWKKASASHQRPKQILLSENDIIRELIWKFLSPTSGDSTIFSSEDWSLRPEIVLRTLSHSSLKSFVDTYGQFLTKLQRMKQFIRICSVVESYPPMYRSYAHNLSHVLSFICRGLDSIEKNLKCEQHSGHAAALPTTLIQFHQALEPITKFIAPLEHLHSQAISGTESTPNWLKALRLISCLEVHLTLITDPQLYGLVLYIFTKCLRNAFDQILRPLELTDWDNNEFLFRRSPVKIKDPNFWNEVITQQPISEELSRMSLRPLSFLNWVLPKVHTILKIREIINQLGSDVGVSCQGLMTRPLPSFKVILAQFLDDLLDREGQPLSLVPINVIPQEPDYLEQHRLIDDHFRSLNLKNTPLAETFRTLLGDRHEYNSHPPAREFDSSYPEIQEFQDIQSIPLIQTCHPLQKALEDHLEPYFRFAHASLFNLFETFDVANTIRLVQEIIFGGKEEFALACIRLALASAIQEQMACQDDERESPNAKFQKLLHQVYPDGRSTFEIEFVLESQSSTANFELKIHPQFPLTLLLTPRTISRYEHVAKEIFKIRKGLWILNRLDPKHCKTAIGVELNRLLLMRFAMIHYWTSLRSFVLFSIFDPNKAIKFEFNENSDINDLLKVYETESGGGVIYRILSFKLMDSIVIKPMLHSSLMLSKKWKTGISLIDLTSLGVRVKRAWELILELGSSSYSPEMNEIAQFFGPIPENIF